MRLRSGSVVLVGLSVVFGVVAACGDSSSSDTPGTPDAATTFDSGPAPGVDGSVTDAPVATDAPAPVDATTDTAPDVVEAGMDAGPTGCSAANGDPYWGGVLAYVPCTTTIEDVTGKSVLTLHNTPTVSATPAGAPGGASCALGNNAGAFNSANGFDLVLPSALGTGDFTVEVSVYQTAWSDPSDQQSEILISNTAYPPAAGSFPSFFSHAGTDAVQIIPGAGAPPYVDMGSALNTWQSYAWSRVNGTSYVFRNGALVTSFADTSDYTGTQVDIGYQSNGTYNAVIGSVGQIRITNAGRYTAGYTACAGGFATK